MNLRYIVVFCVYLSILSGNIGHAQNTSAAPQPSQVLAGKIMDVITEFNDIQRPDVIALWIEDLLKKSEVSLVEAIQALSFLAQSQDDQRIKDILSLVNVTGELDKQYGGLGVVPTQTYTTDSAQTGPSGNSNRLVGTADAPPIDGGDGGSDY